jgi:hypothetical protein
MTFPGCETTRTRPELWLDPWALEAARMADRHSVRTLSEIVRESDGADLLVAKRALDMVTSRIAARSVAEPEEAVLLMLGPRPAFLNDDHGHSLAEPSLRSAWDEAVQAVAHYKSDHDARSFPSENPTDELIGLRALSPDLTAWDRVDGCVGRYMAMCPQAEPTLTQHVELGIELEL